VPGHSPSSLREQGEHATSPPKIAPDASLRLYECFLGLKTAAERHSSSLQCRVFETWLLLRRTGFLDFDFLDRDGEFGFFNRI